MKIAACSSEAVCFIASHLMDFNDLSVPPAASVRLPVLAVCLLQHGQIEAQQGGARLHVLEDMFANTSSKNTQIREKLSRLTSDLVSLQKSFPQVNLVSVVTDEDCTRNEILKKLRNDKGKINIIILVGDILYNSLNRPYFKTIDTELDIFEDSAVSISQIREKLVGGQDSIIVVTNQYINFYGPKGDIIIKEKISTNPMASVETPVEDQLGLLDKLIQKIKTDLSRGIKVEPLLESIASYCLETRNSRSPNGT